MRTVCEQMVSRQLAEAATAHHRARDLGHARLPADATDPRTLSLADAQAGCSTTPRAADHMAPGTAVLVGWRAGCHAS
jgi:hypothetical protein